MLGILQGLNRLFGTRTQSNVWADTTVYNRAVLSTSPKGELEVFEDQHNRTIDMKNAEHTKAFRNKVIRRTLEGAGITFLALGALTLLVGLLYHFGVLQLMLHKAVVIGSANPIAWQTTVYGGVLFTMVGGILFGIKLARDGIHRKVASYASRSFGHVEKNLGDKAKEIQTKQAMAKSKKNNLAQKQQIIKEHIASLKEEYDDELLDDELLEDHEYASELKEGESIVADGVIIDSNHKVIGSIMSPSGSGGDYIRMNYSIYTSNLVEIGEFVYNNIVFSKDGEPVARLKKIYHHTSEKNEWARQNNPPKMDCQQFLSSDEWIYDCNIYSGTNELVAIMVNHGTISKPNWKREKVNELEL